MPFSEECCMCFSHWRSLLKILSTRLTFALRLQLYKCSLGGLNQRETVTLRRPVPAGTEHAPSQHGTVPAAPPFLPAAFVPAVKHFRIYKRMIAGPLTISSVSMHRTQGRLPYQRQTSHKCFHCFYQECALDPNFEPVPSPHHAVQ